MKKFFILSFLLTGFVTVNAQKIENIYINLYTDSLKKGVHNYINVDGKMSDGTWKPLTDKELKFETDYGKFVGNDLVLPENPSVKQVNVKVTLKNDLKKTKNVTIAIKQQPDPILPPYNPASEMKPKRRGR